MTRRSALRAALPVAVGPAPAAALPVPSAVRPAHPHHIRTEESQP
ncbi:hypothetical protein [Streptomyces sp. YPW6]